MKPLRVLLPEDELARLERWSKRRGWSRSQTIRFAIRALTSDEGILGSSGMIDGLPADLSENVDASLAKAQRRGRAAKPIKPAKKRGARAKRIRRQ